MYTEDQLLPISALQHLIFCERQCALIHVERLWAENRLTIEGRHLHDKAHTATTQSIDGVRIARGLRLHSFELGLYGQADVVEFVLEKGSETGTGPICAQHPPGRPDRLDLSPFPPSSPRPIEYKRGKPKKNDSDRVQLCAQAICLEEMLGASIDQGFLFYGKRKRRTEVRFDAELRALTIQKSQRLHQMIAEHQTPPAVREPKCDHCSLLHLCIPDALRFKTGALAFVSRSLAAHLDRDGPLTDEYDFVATSDTKVE